MSHKRRSTQDRTINKAPVTHSRRLQASEDHRIQLQASAEKPREIQVPISDSRVEDYDDTSNLGIVIVPEDDHDRPDEEEGRADEEEEQEGNEDDDEEGQLWVLDDELYSQINPDNFNSPGEMIAFAYWVKYLSGVLPAYDSASNPYRKLSTLALASPVLMNTIVSLATEYMYCHGRAAPEVTMQRHDRALSSLREALNTTSTPSSSFANTGNAGSSELNPKQATLAAVLLQIANVVFIGGTGLDVHLACAMHFLIDLGYTEHPVEDFVGRLLVQRFAILDVITSISKRRRPSLPASFWFFIPDDKYDRSTPSFREMTGCPQPVLGFLSRLSNLAVDLAEKAEYDVLTKASTLETDMRIYARSRVTFSSTRPAPARHLDTLSQCFYWSAHLILQRVIYRDSPTSPRVQQTVSNIVRLIKEMPLGCGPDSSLQFSFYISSREAITPEHRAWVRERNRQLKQVYPGRSRDALMGLLEEIWAAIDAGKEERARVDRHIDDSVRGLEQKVDLCLF